MIEKYFAQIMQGENERAALSGLRAEIKDENIFETVKKRIGDGGSLVLLLSSSDAKVRKNAAALLGDLEIKEAAQALYDAWKKEEKLFIRGTMLKALGQTNSYPYLSELKEYYEDLCRREVSDEEKKHVREELHALEEILRQEGEEVRHTFIGWDQRHKILLTANPKYAFVTAEQFSAFRKKTTSLGVLAIVDNLREIAKICTYRELLFPIRLERPVSLYDGPEAFGEALADSKLIFFLERCHREPAPFYFRIDIKGGLSLEERSRYTKRAAAVIEEKSERKLINAPKDYEFEVRLILDAESGIHVFLKMFTFSMDRFAYRKASIATSMHPSLAAMLFELARPYLKEKAQILDPCCGAGTMLVERHKALPAREIYGIDIFGEAVAKARVNTEAAGMRVNFILKDYMEFRHDYLFDEIISNLPMRGKRSKEEHDLFYREFFDQSEQLLSSDGIMILYTNEAGFVKKQIRLHPVFRLRKEYLIREKDGFWLFVIEMSEYKNKSRN